MTSLWYSPADGLPPLNIQVLVQWRGREFEAARVKRPGRAGYAWLAATSWVQDMNGRWVRRRSPAPVWLPDDGLPGIREDLGSDPDVWRPLKPEAWKLPLPPPVASIAPGRMWSSRTRFAAVEEAEAADLVREMEADRETARAQSELQHESGRETGLPWWRDATRVTYARPGAIRVEEAEARVSRAILTDGLRLERAGVQVVRASSALADMVAETASSEHDDPGHWRNFYALPQDYDDELTAMRWFAAINPPDLHRGGTRPANHYTDAQRLLVWRAQSRSWREIAADLYCSDTQARRLFGGALFQVWCAANGWPVFRHVTVKDQLAALRERNRAAIAGAGESA